MDEQQIAKLKKLLALINDGLTKKDFVESFANIVKQIEAIRKQNAQEIATMHRNIELLSQRLTSDSRADLSDIKSQVNQLQSNLLAKHDANIAAMDAKLDSVQDGKDGEDGKDGADGKDGSPDGPEQVRDKLESLEGDQRLDVSAIKGLEDYAEVSKLARTPYQSLGGGAVRPRIFHIDLSSQLNGSLKTFTIGNNFGIIAVNSSSAPFGAFVPTTDYNSVGKTIVFTANVDAPSALAAGQSLVVTYLK